MVAADSGDTKIISYILAHPQLTPPKAYQYHGRTALHHAARSGHLAAFKLILESGDYDLEQKDIWGMSAFYLAMAAGQVDIVRFLVQSHPDQIDLFEKNKAGVFALSHPIQIGGRPQVLNVIFDSELGRKNAKPLREILEKPIHDLMVPGSRLPGGDLVGDQVRVVLETLIFQLKQLDKGDNALQPLRWD